MTWRKVNALNGIRYFRKKNHMTQSELAEMLGVTQTSVSQWEGGRNYPDIKTAKRLAEMFGATLDQILGMDRVDQAALPQAPDFAEWPAPAPMARAMASTSWSKGQIAGHHGSPLSSARQRILDRAEIYLELELLDRTGEAEENSLEEEWHIIIQSHRIIIDITREPC